MPATRGRRRATGTEDGASGASRRGRGTRERMRSFFFGRGGGRGLWEATHDGHRQTRLFATTITTSHESKTHMGRATIFKSIYMSAYLLRQRSPTPPLCKIAKSIISRRASPAGPEYPSPSLSPGLGHQPRPRRWAPWGPAPRGTGYSRRRGSGCRRRCPRP